MSSVSKPRVRHNRHKQGLNLTLEKLSADFREYKNVANYTVEIVQNGEVKKSFKYSEKPDSLKLANGTYELKAWHGSESNVSRNNFLVTGSTPFTLQGKDITVNVDCKPTCGKLVTKFDTAEMNKFFSNYYVEYETAALKVEGMKAIWAKADTEPYYVKLNPQGENVSATIHYVRFSDGKEQTQKVSYEMLPNKKWTLNIKPKNDSGNLGVDITIDETTNDKDITIDIPSEWL